MKIYYASIPKYAAIIHRQHFSTQAVEQSRVIYRSLLDICQTALFRRFKEQNARAISAGTTSPASAVNVRVHILHNKSTSLYSVEFIKVLTSHSTHTQAVRNQMVPSRAE